MSSRHDTSSATAQKPEQKVAIVIFMASNEGTCQSDQEENPSQRSSVGQDVKEDVMHQNNPQRMTNDQTQGLPWWQRLQSAWQKAKYDNDFAEDTTKDANIALRDDERIALDAAVQALLSGDSQDQKQTDDYTRIQHCLQLEKWDCGIACIIMILRWLRNPQDYPTDSTLTFAEMEERTCMLEEIGTHSVWTADLVLFMDKLVRDQQHGCRYLFCSKTLDVDHGHSDIGYYRAAFDDDRVRVTTKFARLKRIGSATLCISDLPTERVLDIVSQETCVAIVLIDHYILLSSKAVENTGGHAKKDTYIGHYVILCGISRRAEDIQIAQSMDGHSDGKETCCLVLMNPGMTNRSSMFVTLDRFEKAWRANGTDDDIIFVMKR